MAKTHTPRQQNWKWYANNAAEPTTQLANENVKPTLGDNTSIIRLRVTVAEIGDANGANEAWSLEYSLNDTDWVSFGAANHWNYADGAATEGNTITGYKTTDADTLGLYYESGIFANLLTKSTAEESDFAIVPTANVTANQDYYFRVLIGGVAVPLNSGETHPVLTSAAAIPEPSVFDSSSVTEGHTVSLYPVPYTGTERFRIKPPRGFTLNRLHPLSRGIQLLYLFNENAGGFASDLSQNNYTGTLTNVSGSGRPQWVPHGLDFTAANVHVISIPMSLQMGSAFSVVTRVYVASFANAGPTIISKHAGSPDLGYSIRIVNSDKTFAGNLSTNGTNWYSGKTTENSIVAGNWYDLAITYGDGYIRGYINGVADEGHGSTPFPIAVSGDVHDSTIAHHVGYDDLNTYPWSGQIEYLYMFNRWLHPEEVAEISRNPYQVFEHPTSRRFLDVITSLGPSVFDSSGVTDVPTVSPQDAATYEPSVFDSSGVTDVPTVSPQDAATYEPNVNDTQAVDENVDLALELVPDVNDGVTVQEDITTLINAALELEPSVFDLLTIEESITAEIAAALDIEPSVFDLIGITESRTVDAGELPDVDANEFESVGVTEFSNVTNVLTVKI